jgi:TolB protein
MSSFARFRFVAILGFWRFWAFFAFAAPAWAQVSPDAIQVYATGQRSTFVVAVPAFDSTGGQVVSGEPLSSIVMNDLKLSGFFSPPDNPAFADETDRLDRQKNTINFAEWHRIGVAFLVRGSYSIQGDKLMAEVRTYDTVSQNFVFGRKYPYGVGEQRRLAHQISDDVIKRLFNEDGNSRSRILFVKQLDPYGKTKQTCVMDADGHGVTALTGIGELTATPCWGARGTEVYYTTYKDFNPDLAGLILPSGKSWWVSRRTGLNISPCWCEVNQKIALTLSRDGNSEIYTIGRDGQGAERITNNRAIDSSPSWSRDGKKIAFTSDRTGGPQIWIKNLESGEETRLSYNSEYNDAAAWSPAGPDRISYCARVDGKFQIFVCNPNGSGLVQLTNSDNNEDPAWAPNGLELIFSSDRSGRKEIYRMFADGANVNQLTNQDACQSPAWSPVLP